MINLGPRRNIVSSPQKPTIYSGPTIPLVYDIDWQHFTNLTKDQIAWFQAQPEWQDFLSYVALSPKAASAAAPIAVVKSSLARSRGGKGG